MTEPHTNSILFTEAYEGYAPFDGTVNNTLQDLCSGNPLSRNKKKIHLIRISLLVTTPVLVLLGLTGYFLHESVSKREQHAEQKEAIFYGRELGDLIHVLQKERDQTALYLSAIGPDTKIYLLDRYAESNLALSTLSAWPVNFDNSHTEHYQSKEVFGNFMSAHRNSLDLINPTPEEEIHFYNKEIEILIKWLYEAITLSRFGGIWKSLVTYKKIVTSKEIAGVERALGSTYFANGGFEPISNYLWYLRQVNSFAYEYNTAQLFSDDVPKMSKILTPSDESHLFVSVLTYRDQLTENRPINSSVIQAKYYYDNMTLFIDKLFTVQKKLGNDISATLAEKEAESMKNIIIAIILMAIIVALFPIQILSLHTQISDIRNYALVLVSKTSELKEEKIKSEDLLYQMVPKYIASQMKQIKQGDTWKGETWKGELFDAATLFVSEIDQFAKMTKEYTASQVIGLLRETYSLFDQRIEKYDVYQFGNIGDKTMIVSGVPKRNRNKYASEIADLAIDILNCFKSMESQSLPGKVALRIGIHSGSVMAGIVGVHIPKYSVFGETVKITSIMETSGLGNMIHISHPAYCILETTKRYTFCCRGEITIKRNKNMKTYWLTGLKSSDHRHSLKDVPVINVRSASDDSSKIPVVQPNLSSMFNSKKSSVSKIVDKKNQPENGSRPGTDIENTIKDTRNATDNSAKKSENHLDIPVGRQANVDETNYIKLQDCQEVKSNKNELQCKSPIKETEEAYSVEDNLLNNERNGTPEINVDHLVSMDIQGLQNKLMGEIVTRQFVTSSLSSLSSISDDVLVSPKHSIGKQQVLCEDTTKKKEDDSSNNPKFGDITVEVHSNSTVSEIKEIKEVFSKITKDEHRLASPLPTDTQETDPSSWKEGTPTKHLDISKANIQWETDDDFCESEL